MNQIERESLRQAVMETMDVMLQSELFTRAAQRSKEDYQSIVSVNLSIMADSIVGRYERILDKIRN